MDHDTRLQSAVKCVQQGATSYRRAAMKYNLSPTTIWRHSNGLLKPGARQGKPPMLSKDEELGVVDVVRLRSRRGLCMDVDEMRYLIRQAAIACGNFPPEGFPSRRYVARFVKRHAKVLCIKHAQVLDITRYEGSTEDRIRSYYKNLEKEIDGLPRDRVWNCDETGFSPRGRSAPRVVCEKGLPANVVKSADRENVSVMACIAADGSALDPMFIFSGVRIKLEWMTGASDTAVCAATESSNINSQLFLHWLKYFDKCLSQRGTERPVVLVLDGHFSHLNYKALAFAVSVKIEIFTLPSHTSHFTQPLDTLVFRALKKGYEDLVKAFPLSHAGARPTKDDVASLVTIAWKAAMIPENVMGSFRCTGIFPLSVDKMLKKIIGVSPVLPIDGPGAIIPHTISARAARRLSRMGISANRARVLDVGLQITDYVSPSKLESRARGTFVGGGRLMTHPEMVEEVKQIAETKARKRREVEERKAARETKKLERAVDVEERKAAREKKKLARAAEAAAQPKRKRGQRRAPGSINAVISIPGVQDAPQLRQESAMLSLCAAVDAAVVLERGDVVQQAVV